MERITLLYKPWQHPYFEAIPYFIWLRFLSTKEFQLVSSDLVQPQLPVLILEHYKGKPDFFSHIHWFWLWKLCNHWSLQLLSCILDNYDASRVTPNEPEEDIKLWVELSQANQNSIKLSAVNKSAPPLLLTNSDQHFDSHNGAPHSRKGAEHPELWQQLSLLGVCQVAADPSFAQFIIVPVLQYLHNGSHWSSALASNLLTVMHHIMAEAGVNCIRTQLIIAAFHG